MDARVPKSELDAANTRIRQLEDEVARLRAVNENARAGRAFRLLEAAWNGGDILPEYHAQTAERAVKQVLALEQALAAQAEREKANG